EEEIGRRHIHRTEGRKDRASLGRWEAIHVPQYRPQQLMKCREGKGRLGFNPPGRKHLKPSGTGTVGSLRHQRALPDASLTADDQRPTLALSRDDQFGQAPLLLLAAE